MPQIHQKRVIHTTGSGARFVWRTSKQTGSKYKQYLPRTTKRIKSSHSNLRGTVFVLNR